MAYIRLTREFGFEMAHALEGYDGHCRHIHGHSYRLFVTVGGIPCVDESNPKYGMVMDFGELKAIVNRLIVEPCDHSLVVRRTAANTGQLAALNERWGRVMMVDYQPTCENMIARFARLIVPELPAGVRLVELKLHETAKSYAVWRADENPEE